MGSEVGEAGCPEQSAPGPACALSGPGPVTSTAPTGLQGAQQVFPWKP